MSGRPDHLTTATEPAAGPNHHTVTWAIDGHQVLATIACDGGPGDWCTTTCSQRSCEEASHLPEADPNGGWRHEHTTADGETIWHPMHVGHCTVDCAMNHHGDGVAAGYRGPDGTSPRDGRIVVESGDEGLIWRYAEPESTVLQPTEFEQAQAALDEARLRVDAIDAHADVRQFSSELAHLQRCHQRVGQLRQIAEAPTSRSGCALEVGGEHG